MIATLVYSVLSFLQTNWKLLVPLYLSVSLALVLFILFISIKSKENGTLYITENSPFFYLRYISYLILLFPLEGITVLKNAVVQKLTHRLTGDSALALAFFNTVIPSSGNNRIR
jgi:hypothetical protein